MANRYFTSCRYDDLHTAFTLYPDNSSNAKLYLANTPDRSKSRNGSTLMYFYVGYGLSHGYYLEHKVDAKDAIFMGFRNITDFSSIRYARKTIFRIEGENDFFDVGVDREKTYTPDGVKHIGFMWHNYIELGFDGQDAIVRLNGVEIYREAQNIGPIKRIRLFAPEKYDSTVSFLQDIYINDGDGASNNGFWGDTRIDIVPVFDVSSGGSGFVEKSGAGTFLEQVQDWPSDKGASYIEGVQTGSQCLFSLKEEENVKLNAVTLCVVGSKMAESESGVSLIYKTNDGVFSGDKQQLPIGSYKLITQSFSEYLDGTAWDWDKIKNASFGVEIVA